MGTPGTCLSMLEACWERTGSMLKHAGGMLGHAGSVLGACWEHAGTCWERVGSILERAGSMLGACWGVPDPPSRVLGPAEWPKVGLAYFASPHFH